MAEPSHPDSDVPEIPETRSNYVSGNAVPEESIAKFDKGNTAWLSVPKKGSVDVTVFARKKENGQFLYQVQGKEGSLYKGGEWVPQAKLTSNA